MKKWLKRLLVLVGILLVCLLAIGLIFNFWQAHTLAARPLVLIQLPVNLEQVETGRGLIVHATARVPEGVKRIELWADDLLISEREAPAEVKTVEMVLSAVWLPRQSGNHILVVRAVSNSGVEGQASVEVKSYESVGSGTFTHTVVADETLESIAVIYGVTSEDIINHNAGIDESGLESGEVLTVPLQDETSGGDLSSPGWEEGADGTVLEPPEAEAEPPGTPDLFLLFAQLFQAPEEPVQLTAEVLALETRVGYESVHCYATLGGSDPRWVPDTDFNPATDESFNGRNEGRDWNVAEYMAGENALNLAWPADQPVTMDISCVGMTAGGLDSVKLGRVNRSVEPDTWGIIQHAFSEGGDGAFKITYLVNWQEKGLDPSITPPWSVRIDEERGSLLWDYYPADAPENTIDGFAILLNGALQWTVPGGVRRTSLPDQWLNLPCGDTYSFEIIAFRDGYPEGDYSYESEAALIQGDEVGSDACGRTVVISFEQLTTGSLDGPTGPVYGSFFANELVASFDGRPIEDDNFPSTFGLNGGSEYMVSNILNGYGSGESVMVVDLPPGRVGISDLLLWVGFEIYRGGTKVCSGDDAISEGLLAGTYHGVVETGLPVGSWPDWCQVSYTLTPLGDSPVVEAGAPPPLPDLVVDDLTVDDSSGKLVIHIRNRGQAAWVNKNIVARVTWPNGEEVGVYTFSNMTLEPGGIAIVSHSDMNPQPPLGACVLLDPENVVLEETDRFEEAGMLGPKEPYCRPLPDLSILSNEYDRQAGELRMVVQNRGETTLSSVDRDGSIIDEDLVLWINLPEGRPLTRVFENINMDARDTIELVWEMGEVERERMQSGYTLTVNPEGHIPELDMSNNDYQVEATKRLRLVWMTGWATFCPTGNVLVYGENIGGKNTWDMNFYAIVEGGRSRRVVADWTSPEIEVTWRKSNGAGWCNHESPFISDWFEVDGDEVLTITRTAGLDITTYGYRWFSGGGESLNAEDDFGGTTHVPEDIDSQCFLNTHRYTYDTGPAMGTGGCGFDYCSIGEEGMRVFGPFVANSEDITGYCWWSTSYVLFEEEE